MTWTAGNSRRRNDDRGTNRAHERRHFSRLRECDECGDPRFLLFAFSCMRDPAVAYRLGNHRHRDSGPVRPALPVHAPPGLLSRSTPSGRGGPGPRRFVSGSGVLRPNARDRPRLMAYTGAAPGKRVETGRVLGSRRHATPTRVVVLQAMSRPMPGSVHPGYADSPHVPANMGTLVLTGRLSRYRSKLLRCRPGATVPGHGKDPPCRPRRDRRGPVSLRRPGPRAWRTCAEYGS